MVARFILAGTSPPSELTTNIEELVYGYIQSNWAPVGGTPTSGSVKFSDQWWDDYGDFHIHVRPIVTVVVKQAIGGTFMQYKSAVGIHLFARRKTEWHTDADINNMVREVERIFAIQPTVISPGILYGELSDTRDLSDMTNFPEVAHKMMTLNVYYAKAVIP